MHIYFLWLLWLLEEKKVIKSPDLITRYIEAFNRLFVPNQLIASQMMELYNNNIKNKKSRRSSSKFKFVRKVEKMKDEFIELIMQQTKKDKINLEDVSNEASELLSNSPYKTIDTSKIVWDLKNLDVLHLLQKPNLIIYKNGLKSQLYENTEYELIAERIERISKMDKMGKMDKMDKSKSAVEKENLELNNAIQIVLKEVRTVTKYDLETAFAYTKIIHEDEFLEVKFAALLIGANFYKFKDNFLLFFNDFLTKIRALKKSPKIGKRKRKKIDKIEEDLLMVKRYYTKGEIEESEKIRLRYSKVIMF